MAKHLVPEGLWTIGPRHFSYPGIGQVLVYKPHRH
jgi:hypothetical protein